MRVRNYQKTPNMRGFILSIGDATPYGTPMETLKAISRLIQMLGPAPLTGDYEY